MAHKANRSVLKVLSGAIGLCPLAMLAGGGEAWAGPNGVLNADMPPLLSEYGEERAREVFTGLTEAQARQFVVSTSAVAGEFPTQPLLPPITSFATGGSSSVIAIDTFSVDHNVSTPSNSSNSQLVPGADGLIGGEREVEISRATTGGAGDTSTSSTQAGSASGIADSLTFSNDAGSGVSGSLTLRYDGTGDSDPTNTNSSGLSPFDVTASGENNFLIFEVLQSDFVGVDFSVTLFASGGSSSIQQTFNPATQLAIANGFATDENDFAGIVAFLGSNFDPTAPGSQAAPIPFDLDDFLLPANVTGTFDSTSLANVTAIELQLDTDSSLDLIIDAVGFVPNTDTSVPFEFESALGLTVLGLGAAWKLRARRKPLA